MQVEMTVPAEEVEKGDSLLGLGGGYVFTDPVVNPDIRIGDGSFHLYQVPGESEIVMISFHDEQGDENYVITGRTNAVLVGREELHKS